MQPENTYTVHFMTTKQQKESSKGCDMQFEKKNSIWDDFYIKITKDIKIKV